MESERAIEEGAPPLDKARLEQEHSEYGKRCDRERRCKAHRCPALEPVRIGEPERCEQEGRKLRPAGERHGSSPGDRRRRQPEAPDEDRGHDRVVRVRVHRVRGEGERDPAEGERYSKRRASESAPDHDQAEDDEQIEPDRGRMRRRQRVPLSRPAECKHCGNVREVCHRTVRVAARVGRFAAAVLLDPIADRTVGVGLAAGRARVLDRHVAVRGLAVEDPVGADHTGVADIDHTTRALEIEADPQPAEEHGNGCKRPNRPGQRRVDRAASEADPGRTHKQVGERWHRERRAPEDFAPVEEPEGESEREQDEQIERMERPEPTPVDEADEEDGTERDPHPPGIEHRASERADPTPRHFPRDLRARPRLGHTAVAVLDFAECDLSGLARPDADGPASGRFVERRIGRRAPRVPVEPAGNLGFVEKACDDNVFGQSRPTDDRREGAAQ